MFGNEKHDSWRWIPFILVAGAFVFLYFDPLGMESTQIRYSVNPQPTAVPTPLQPQPNPPPPNPPAPNPPPAAPRPPLGDGEFPSALNTGPQTPPTKTWPQSGNGTWINVGENADGFIFNGCVRTTRSGVRITNSEIRGNCTTSQLYDEGGNGVFEYNNIFDVVGGGASTIGCGNGSRFFRNNAKGAADGVKEGSGCQIIENYIHDLDEYNAGVGGGTHNDGVQIEGGGTTGMLIQKNTFENTCGKRGIAGQGCAGTIFVNNGASGNTIEGNYVKRWDGPTAGFIFHLHNAGANTVKDNIVECGAIAGFGVAAPGISTFTNNTQC